MPENAAAEFLKKLKTPCRLLIAYSGGGDSTGLMVALAEALKADPGIDVSLVAATVDHGLRPESAAEARAVGAVCAKFSIPHHILTWQGEKPKTGIQAAAREARYRLLGALADRLEADLVVTAHNLDDQAETVAMRRSRNPAATGGISQAVLYDRHIWICRPFLGVRRAAIRAYLTGRGIGWVDDPSNDNEAFERVRIRKSLSADADAAEGIVDADRTGETARFLLASTVVHFARVAVLDLGGYLPDDPAHLRAVRHLAALMGGRTHLAGGEMSGRLARFLAGTEEMRLTAERVVFDRRKHLLYLVRERRSLPVTTVAPGASALWDGRFRIENHGDQPAVIGVRDAAGRGQMLLTEPLPDDLPGAVRQRIHATEPMLLDGRLAGLSVGPVIAQFDRFLPLPMFEVANALAFLTGLDHFPGLPTR